MLLIGLASGLTDRKRMAQKKPRIVLPAGIAVFPKLNEVDVYQPVDKKGKPSGAEKRRYITYVRYDEATLTKVKEAIVAAAIKLGADADVKLPLKKLKIKDDKGNVTGHEYVVQATSGEKYQPAIFDAKLNKVPVVIGGGSKIKLDVSVNYYEGFGGGINLYLNGVQVLELVEGGKGKSAFTEDEGFEYEGSEETTAFTATGGEADALSL